MIRLLILCSMLAGCAGGVVQRSVQDGEVVVEHIDTTDQPPTCGRSPQHGCFQIRLVDGVFEKHIWRSSVGPGYVKRHEWAHKSGLQHTIAKVHPLYSAALTDYQKTQTRHLTLCSTILVGVSGYPTGHLLCNDGKSEWTIAP